MTFTYTTEWAETAYMNYCGFLREHLLNSVGRRRAFMLDNRILPPYPGGSKAMLWECLLEEKKRLEALYMVDTGQAPSMFKALDMMLERHVQEARPTMEALI